MNIRDFMDLNKLQELQDKFASATGLAAIAVDNDGEYITTGSNFTEFCMKHTSLKSKTLLLFIILIRLL